MGFYDEQIKSLYEQCPRLVILSINSIFGKHHREDAEVIYLNKELQGGTEEHATYMDMFLEIDDSRYHFEFQMQEDYMAIRMYEYAVRETLREAKVLRVRKGAPKYELELHMPQQAVIFLTGVNAQDTIRVSMTLPNGKKARYELPCVSAAQSIEQLIEKRLYILVPFQMVQENKRLLQLRDSEEECNLPEDERRALDDDRISAAGMVVTYQRNVRIALEKLQKDAKITSEEVSALTEVFKNVEYEMLKESKKILTEVAAMGPQVTETYSQMLRREGREAGIAEGREAGLAEGREVGLAEGREAGLAEGREAGIAEGREAGLIEAKMELVRNLLDSGMSPEEVAERTKLPLEQILQIQNVAIV